jgi:LysM repeat protein
MVTALLALLLSGASTVAAASPPASHNVLSTNTCVVRWGNNLTRIAAWYGTTVSRLAALNGIVNPNRTCAGKVLRIPSSGQRGTIDQTNIYLIAQNDNGQSGPEIGCGDSVVPVEMVISPTNAPLKASLTKLLSIKDQDSALSGLYNALYTSDLQVTSVVIVNRQSIVNLSAQLQETALQFSTVDSVAISVNGVLLEDVL